MATTTRRTRKATTAKPADTEPTTTTAPDPTDISTTEATDPTATDPTATDPTATDPAPTGSTGDTPTNAPVSGAPVSGAPVGSGDHLKIVMVAGILGDHPDGVSASAIVDESGLRAAIVGRVLAAMETAGAAARKAPGEPADESDASGTELWVRGDADLTTVDLSAAAVREVCPTCQRPMPRRNTVSVARTGTAAPGHNSDGQRTLGKGELENLVRDFLRANPGHEFTALTIARELGRSSGAVGNALAKLVTKGEALLVKDAPMIYSLAPAPADATHADTATPAQSEPATTGNRPLRPRGREPTFPAPSRSRPHTETEGPTP